MSSKMSHECMKKIRDLDSLPADAFETYISICFILLNWLTELHNTFFYSVNHAVVIFSPIIKVQEKEITSSSCFMAALSI